MISTGWDAIDRALAPGSPRTLGSDALAHVGFGGLQRGVMHEWLCDQAPMRHCWFPPHSLFIHLAWRAIEAGAEDSGVVVWIGRRVWPQANVLRGSATEFTTETRRHGGRLRMGEWTSQKLRGNHSHDLTLRAPSNLKSQIPSFLSGPLCLRGESLSSSNPNALLARSIFIDPTDDASRLWAIDLALRSSAAGVVIADGSKLKMAESRRLQLAAERSRALALLARPAWEAAELSAATTRWRVRRMPAPQAAAPRWMLELLRCRHGCALRMSSSSQECDELSSISRGAWEMEYASPGHVRLVADVVDRSGSPSATATSWERTG